jgi:hypothetical protein
MNYDMKIIACNLHTALIQTNIAEHDNSEPSLAYEFETSAEVHIISVALFMHCAFQRR